MGRIYLKFFIFSHKFHINFQQYVLTIAKNGYNIYAVQQTRTKSAKIYKELEGENVLDDRKKQILQAIIEEYINTAEPVSSGALVQKYNLDYSSATIRNEMADLEKSGYLDKPHTSSRQSSISKRLQAICRRTIKR